MFTSLVRSWLRASPAARTPARLTKRPQLEELEPRLVMAASVSLTHGVLRAVADNKPTTMTLRQVGGSTVLNGLKAATNSIKRIEIVGGAKADTVVIQDTPAGKPVVVKTGGGNDVVEVGTGANLMNGIKGQLKVNAGAGDDLVRLAGGVTAARLSLSGGGGVNSLAGLPASGSTVAYRDFGHLINRPAVAPPPGAAVSQLPIIEKFPGRIIPPSAWGPSLEAKAVQLDGELGLHRVEENEWENSDGKGEKWLVSYQDVRWYFILPNGELYQSVDPWGNVATGELVATLDPTYHADIKNLTRADTLFATGQIEGPIAQTAARLATELTLRIDGEDDYLNWGGKQEKWFLDSNDHWWYFILPNGEFYRLDSKWTQVDPAGMKRIQAEGELLAKFDTSYYQDLNQLADAQDRFGSLDALALQAIQMRHLRLDGDAGNLGPAVSELQTTADGRARFVNYRNGAIYWTVDRGALAVTSGDWPKYSETGAHTGPLGLPTVEVQKIKGGLAAVTRFEGGAIYGSAATDVVAVHSGNWLKYQEFGGHDGAFGLPTSDETRILNGTAVVATYQGGAVYWSEATGLRGLQGGNWWKYQQMGAHDGPLGLPVSQEESVRDDDYRIVRYQGGTIVWKKATGEMFEVHGLIHARWIDEGGINGWMGAPTSHSEEDVPGGKVSHFEHASLYFKWGTAEAIEVHGAIRDRYRAMGGPASVLGFPTLDEHKWLGDTFRESLFEGGSIVWEKATAKTVVVKGLVHAKWQALGGITGRLGAPLSEELDTPRRDGVHTDFQRGSVYFKWGTVEAFAVEGAIRDAWARAMWEQGQYGWPTSDEILPNGVIHYKHQKFENNTTIYWTDPTDHQAWNPLAADVRQRLAGTCVILSSLAAHARSNQSLADRVRPGGVNIYEVYLPGPDEWERVFFDGTFNHLDPMPVVGLSGQAKFWTVLFHRAMLQNFDVDWTDQNWKEWDTDYGDTEDVLEDLTGWDAEVIDQDDFGPAQEYLGHLQRGDRLVAFTVKNGGDMWLAGSVGKGTHQFMVNDVFPAHGRWFVQLYNPHGRDGDNGARPEDWNGDGSPDDTNPNDGLVTLEWGQFTRLFEGIGVAERE